MGGVRAESLRKLCWGTGNTESTRCSPYWTELHPARNRPSYFFKPCTPCGATRVYQVDGTVNCVGPI